MIKGLFLTAIGLFQRTRVWRQPACRFYPSCSQYAYGCIDKHGLCKGTLLSIWRLLRCQPLYPGGIEDVPAEFKLSLKKLVQVCHLDLKPKLKNLNVTIACTKNPRPEIS